MNNKDQTLSRRALMGKMANSAAILTGGALIGSEAEAAVASAKRAQGRLPKDFVWGTATASYQVEGSPLKDGGGASIWDTFSKKPGVIKDGNTGDTACDHVHRYQEDVDLMKRLGTNAYRFSFSWSRILPEGAGRINQAGLDFYDRLIDALLIAGVAPWATIFHWDYPEALYQKGGWRHPDAPNWFADFTKILADRYSDRVAHWMTFNEPQVFVSIGHQFGAHAPGERLPTGEMSKLAHNILLSHGKSVQVLRSASKKPLQIGIAAAPSVTVPASDSPADVALAKKMMLSVSDFSFFGPPGPNFFNNTWWLDPMFLGHYPEDGLKLFGKDAPAFTDADMKTIHQPLDFLGLNIYFGPIVKSGENGRPEKIPTPAGVPHTTTGWEIVPSAIYWGTKVIGDRYKKPIYITENGMANTDWVAVDGKVHDPQRIDFMTRYLGEIKHARAEGVDIRGYFAWSLMDNFEWAEGFNQRFGLVYVDFATQKRTPKDSYFWYRDYIKKG